MFYSLKVEHQRLQESLREETCLSHHIVEGITIIQWHPCHLQNKIEEVKYSNSYVLYETQHALLLHWNRLTIPILQKMARAHRFHEGGTKKTVVVSLTARTHARAPADHPRRSPAQPILTPAALFRW